MLLLVGEMECWYMHAKEGRLIIIVTVHFICQLRHYYVLWKYIEVSLIVKVME